MQKPYIDYAENRILLHVEIYDRKKAESIGGRMAINGMYYTFPATWENYQRIFNTFHKLKGTKKAIAWAKANKPIQDTPEDVEGLKNEIKAVRKQNENLLKLYREANGKKNDLQNICNAYKAKIQKLEYELEYAKRYQSGGYYSRGASGGNVDKKKMAKLLHPDFFQAALKDRPDLMEKITQAMQMVNNM